MNQPKKNIDIGEVLSKRRIQLNKSIDTIANDIHLSPDIIDKLENNKFNEIGSPVYTRGYLAAYAKILKLNTEEILAYYQKVQAANEISIKPALGHVYGKRNLQEKQRSKTISFLVASLAFFATLGLYFFNEELLSSWINKNKSLVSNSKIEIIDTSDNSTDNESIINNSNSSDNNLLQAKKKTNQTITKLEIITPTISEAEQLLSDQNQDIIVSQKNTTEAVIDAPQINLLSTQNFENESSGDLINQPLSIQFSSSCWIKIIDQNNTIVISKLYQPGSNVNITAKGQLTIITGRPNAIKKFNYAGRDFNLSKFRVSKNKYLITP